MKTYNVLFWMKPASFSQAEGLVVLLCDLIKGLQSLDVRVRIFVSARHERSLRFCLDQNRVSPSAYEIRAFPVAPAALTVMAGPPRAKKQLKKKKLYGERTSLRRVFARWLARLDMWEAGFLIVVLSPLFVVAALLGFALMPLWRVVRPRGKVLLRRLRKSFKSTITRGIATCHRELLEHAFDREALNLIEKVNGHEDVRAVFVPVLFVGRPLAALRWPALVVFPDAVPLAFPSRFIGEFNQKDYTRLAESIRHASAIVCYSAYTVNRQLKALFADCIGNKPIHVVPHGFFSGRANATASSHKRIESKIIFPEYIKYIPKYDLREIVYVFYPSIDRAHKNLLTLLRAVEHLIRRHHCNIKVISTSHHVSSDTREFICHHKLFLDVLFTGSLDEESFLQVIQHAALVVHPSLSEGGYPFNFSLAVANGVPALLADTAVVREMFEHYGFSDSVYANWTFPPTDYLYLSELIRRSLEERKALCNAQAALLHSVSTYDYAAMARRYLDAYEQTAAVGGAHG